MRNNNNGLWLENVIARSDHRVQHCIANECFHNIYGISLLRMCGDPFANKMKMFLTT